MCQAGAFWINSHPTMKMHTTVSSKEIQKARRLAKRTRSAVACARCKASKVKCNDYRPCKQCLENLNCCDNGTFQYSAKQEVTRKAEYNRHISGSSSLSTQSQAQDYSKEIEIIPQKFNVPATALLKTHPNHSGAADLFQGYSDAVCRVFQSVPLGLSSGCPILTSVPQNQHSTQFSQQLKLDLPLNPPCLLPSLHGPRLLSRRSQRSSIAARRRRRFLSCSPASSAFSSVRRAPRRLP